MTRVNLPANDFPNHEWPLMTRTKMDLIRSLSAIALGDGRFVSIRGFFVLLSFGREIKPND